VDLASRFVPLVTSLTTPGIWQIPRAAAVRVATLPHSRGLQAAPQATVGLVECTLSRNQNVLLRGLRPRTFLDLEHFAAGARAHTYTRTRTHTHTHTCIYTEQTKLPPYVMGMHWQVAWVGGSHETPCSRPRVGWSAGDEAGPVLVDCLQATREVLLHCVTLPGTVALRQAAARRRVQKCHIVPLCRRQAAGGGPPPNH